MLRDGWVKRHGSELSCQQARYLLGLPNEIRCDPSTGPAIESFDRVELCREQSRTVVRRFLNHPEVGHHLGGTIPASRAVFSARYKPTGNIIALAVFSIPSASALNRHEVHSLKRYAAHPHAPPNMASWLISRGLDWAKLEGYEQVRSYAGVGDNKGTIYQALNFEALDSGDPITTDGEGWTNRDRGSWKDYEKRRYVYNIDTAREVCHRSPPPDEAGNGVAADGGPLDKWVALSVDSSPLAPADRAEEATLAQAEVGIVRRDNRPSEVADALQELDNEVAADRMAPVTAADPETVAEKADALFGVAMPAGLLAVCAVTEVTVSGEPMLVVTAYGQQEVAYQQNMTASLLGAVRRWAALEGFTRVRVTPVAGSTLATALAQTGFTDADAAGTSSLPKESVLAPSSDSPITTEEVTDVPLPEAT